ncbi:MAG: DUF3857 domain-containing protein [Alphaproteobacteria bacterium]|nr:DUF3857 domain-containing protein [Alphaproteobacteria bacterium]
MRLRWMPLLLLLALGPASAKEDEPYEVGPMPEWIVEPPLSATPEQLLAATEVLPSESGDAVQVLLLEATWVYDADGLPTAQYRMIYRVLKRDPGYWAQATANWRPWLEERPDVQARVVSRSGKEWTLDPKTLSEISNDSGAGAAASADTQLVAPLPGLGVGAVVEVVTTKRHTAPTLPGLHSDDYVFGLRSLRVAHERLVLDTPEDLRLSVESHNVDVEPTEDRADGRRRLTWVLDAQEKATPTLDLLPPEVNPLTSVSWSTRADWSAASRGAHERVEVALADADLGALAKQWAGEARDRSERLDALTRGLRAKVRPIERDLSDDDLTPQTPAETLKRGTGDSLDQATLLVALLRALGEQAHVALLIADGPALDPALPEPHRLDHALVWLPGEPPLAIFPALSGFGPGVMPWWAEGRELLVARAEGPALERVPETTSADHLDRIELEYDLRGRLTAQLHYLEVGVGRAAASERAMYEAMGESGWAERQQDWAESALGAEVDAVGGYQGISPLSAPVELELEVARSDRVSLDGEALRLRPSISAVAELSGLRDMVSRYVDDERELDVAIAPQRVETAVLVHLPPGFEEAELPEDVHLEIGPVVFSRTLRIEDGALHLDATLDTGDGRLSAEQARDFVERAGRVGRNSELRSFTLRSAAGEALKDDRYTEALLATRAMAEAWPDDPIVAYRYAQVLSELRLMEPAVAELERAVSLDPELYDAWRRLAKLRLSGRWGRFAFEGWDLAGARDAALRAIRLRPDKAQTVLDNYLPFITSPEGIVLGPGLDPEPAIEVFEQARARLEEDDFRRLWPIWSRLLMFSGRAGDLIDDPLTASIPVSYAATLALEGDLDAAKAQLDDIGGFLRAQAIESSVLLLIDARAYDAAEALRQALAEEDEEKEDEGEEKGDDAEEPKDPLAWLTGTRRVEDLGRPDSADDKLLRAVLPAVYAGAPPEGRVRIPEPVREALFTWMRRARATAGVPDHALADAMLSHAVVTAEGSWRSGRVLRVDLSALGVEEPKVLAVRKEGRDPIVLAADDAQLAGLADQALRDGDRDLARLMILPWVEERHTTIPELPANLRERYADLLVLVDPSRVDEPGWLEAVIGRLLEWEDLDDARAKELADQALATGLRDVELHRYRWYSALEIDEGVEESARSFAEALTESRRVDQIRVLVRSGLIDEAQAIADERWKNPDAPDALRARAWIQEAREDMQGHVDAFTKLAETHEAEDDELRALAWGSLFLDEMPEDALEYIQRAQRMVDYPVHDYYRVEACVRLGRGEPDEAWELLSAQLSRTAWPLDEGWRVVLGGLAQRWDMPELVEEMLGGVEVTPEPFTRYALAQRWLAAGSPEQLTPWRDEGEEDPED